MNSAKQQSADLVGDVKTFALHWGLPIAAMVASTLLSHPSKTMVWAASLIWMGAACLINARRCGRIHCYYTGPLFLFMVIPVLLHGYQIWWLGPNGWMWLGIAVAVGGVGLWYLTEKVLGRYS